MRPRRTPESNAVFRLVGGNEDNDLWATRGTVDGAPFVDSVWELDDQERQLIGEHGTVELRVYALGTPPVSLIVGPSIAERKAAGKAVADG